jgi:hypothetical protein
MRRPFLAGEIACAIACARSSFGGLVCALVSVLVAACSGQTARASPDASPMLADDGAYGGSFPGPYDNGGGQDATTDPTSNLLPSDVGARDDDETDARANSAPDTAMNTTPDGACRQPLAPGDLRIDELMIESVAGAGDDGEWIEIESALDCTANLNGLHGECPRGAKVTTFDVTGDLWIPPGGTFVVADSSDPAINHDVPGMVVIWFGHTGDVLRNKGSTITVSLNGTLLDTVTYPALTLAVGDSVAFPSDCDPTLRSDFTQWKRSTASWFPGFLGTPNAPNTDVKCP